MTEHKDLPDAGFRAVAVFASELSYRVLDPENVESYEGEGRPLNFGWDWRLGVTEEEEIQGSILEVRVRVKIGPTPSLPERAIADMIGRFQVASETSISISEFVLGAAPAIIMPYVRERIADLTATGPYGAYHFPIVNVQALMRDMDYEDSTGFRQLQSKKGEQEEAAADS